MASSTLVPSGYSDLTGMSIDSQYEIDRAYTNSSSTTYARFNVTQSTKGSVYLTFNTSAIPANATITSVSAQFKARVSSTTRITNTGAQLYSGTTAKGSSTAFASTTASVRTMSVGSWSRSDLNDLRIYITGTASSSTSSRRIDFYGADVTIEYTTGTVHVTSVTLSPSTASIEVGSTTQLTETVLPADATDKSVSWSSSNTSVATVSSGTVTGVSAGSATITVTTTDGGYTDTCAVTVTPAVTYEYKLATSMQVGKKYLIANGNSGTVYLLSNESGGSRQLVGVSASVVNGRITINGATKAKTEFECVRYTSGNDNTITVTSDSKYVYSDNGTGLRMNAPATLDRFWHYRDNKFWQFKSTTADGYTDASTEYKYYLELDSSNNYTDNHVTSPSIADSTLPAIYIYVYDDGVQTDTLYFKQNGAWVEVAKAYKKVSGSWVEQVDVTQVFNAQTNYVKGN